MGLHKLKSGNYVARFQIDGHETRRSAKTANRKEALEFERALKAEVQSALHRGRLNVPETRTFRQALHRWLEEGAPYDSMKGHINVVARELGSVQLAQLPSQASLMASRMLTGGLSRLTVNRRLSVVRAVLAQAYDRWHWLSEPLAQKVKLFSEAGSARDVFLSKEQVFQILDEVQSGIARDVIIVAAYTGMRRGEILALDQSHVHEDELHLGADITKSSKPRVIPMTRDVREIVQNRVPFQITVSELHREFGRARDAVGMSHVRFHDLRHSFASWLAANPGVPLTALRDLLGHSSLAVTNRYSHLRSDALKDAIATLET